MFKSHFSICVHFHIGLMCIFLFAGFADVGTTLASSGISFTGMELTVIGDVGGVGGPHTFRSDFATENPLTSPTIVTNPDAQGVLPSGKAFLGYALDRLTLTDGTNPGDTSDPYENEVAPADPSNGVAGVSGMLVAFGENRVADTSVTAGDALNDASRAFIKKLNYSFEPLVPGKVVEVRLEGGNGIVATVSLSTFGPPEAVVADFTLLRQFSPGGSFIGRSHFLDTADLLAYQRGMIVLSKDRGLSGDTNSFISAELITDDASQSINLGPLSNTFIAGSMKDPFLAGAPIIPEPIALSLLALAFLGFPSSVRNHI